MNKNKIAIAKPAISIKWNMLNVGLQLILRLSATIYFMKFIKPELYGVYTLAVIFLEGAKIITERGYPGAIIQNKEVSRMHFSYFLAKNLKTGIFLWLFCLVIQLVFIREYSTELLVLSTAIFMISLISTPRAFNQKELKFKRIAYVEVFSLTIGLLSGFAVLKYGGGLWALVTAYLVNTTFSAVLFLSDQKEKLSSQVQARPTFFKFSRSLLINNMVLYLAKFIDQFITSFFFGLDIQGLYNRTLAFISVPVSGISRSVSEVLLPYLSIKDSEKNTRFYFRTVQIFLFLLIPGLFSIYFLMDLVVEFVGLEWAFLKSWSLYIIIASIPMSLNFLFGALLVFSGDRKLVYQAMILKRISSIGGILIGAIWGIHGLIIGKIISEFINFFINVFQTEQILGESYTSQALIYKETLLVSILCLLIVFANQIIFLSLALIICSSAIVYLLFDKQIFKDSFKILKQLINPNSVSV
jgi:O-antigen/teichoic acid export membrane protein